LPSERFVSVRNDRIHAIRSNAWKSPSFKKRRIRPTPRLRTWKTIPPGAMPVVLKPCPEITIGQNSSMYKGLVYRELLLSMDQLQ